MKTKRELAEEGQDAHDTMILALECGHNEVAYQAEEKWHEINEMMKRGEYIDED